MSILKLYWRINYNSIKEDNKINKISRYKECLVILKD